MGINFYLWNCMLMTFLIVLSNAALVAVAVEETGNRLQICVTLLLAQVAQKLFVAQTQPVTNYLTLLDWHSVSGLLLIVVSTTEVVVAGRLHPRYCCLPTFDTMFHCALASSWLGSHLCVYYFMDCFRPAWDQTDSALHWQDVFQNGERPSSEWRSGLPL